MNHSSKRNLSIRPISIGKIIELYRQGTFAIPEFQRDYVWKASRAPKLLDSLWNHYPIGSLLTWSTEDDVESRVKSRVMSPTQWIIDGQQRTRTLVKISDGEIPILFDLKKCVFLIENAATKRTLDPTLIPVSEIWGPSLSSVLKKLDGVARSVVQEREFEQRLQDCRDLLKIDIPQIHLEGHSIEQAIVAFQRINTQGIRLKSTDIEISQLTVKHSGFVKNSVQPYLDRLKQKGWERVYLSQLFIACEGIADGGARGDQRKRLHDLSKADLNFAWRKLTCGLDEAIQMLRDELGVHDMSIFPTGALLMPVAVLLSGAIKNPPKSKAIIDWMISASLTRRYSGSSQEKLDRDIIACFESNPIKSLHRNNKKDSGRSRIAPDVRNFDSALHDRYAMFLTYLACRISGMRDVFDGRTVSSSSAEWHHIIPRKSVGPNHRRQLDNPANISFILGPTNRSISNKRAELYLPEVSKRLLESQCIPVDPLLWNRPANFMRARAKLLAKTIQHYLLED